MLKWSTTARHERSGIENRLLAEKMSLQSLRICDAVDEDGPENFLSAVTSAQSVGRKWKQVERGGAERKVEVF